MESPEVGDELDSAHMQPPIKRSRGLGELKFIRSRSPSPVSEDEDLILQEDREGMKEDQEEAEEMEEAEEDQEEKTDDRDELVSEQTNLQRSKQEVV
jgi:hypothetical protein